MRRIISVSLIFLVLCTGAFGAESVILIIRDVPHDFFEDAVPDGAAFDHADDTCTVIGSINVSSFEVASINNVTLYDSASRQIPLRIEKSSIYREFDEINSMRFAFEISRKSLSAGPPRLVWGGDVSANNVEVEKILIDGSRRERYRTFSWEEPAPEPGDSSRVATLEVIVDDYADKYYLWYLLPMGLIFGLLIIRKLYLDKPSPAESR